MIIKRINDNTISCTISPEDLKANGFELDDFFDRKKEAVEFIRQTVAQIAISENFDLQGEMTTMRISVLPDRSLNLLITRETSKNGASKEVRRLAKSLIESIASRAAEKAREESGDQDDGAAFNSLMKSLLSGSEEGKGEKSDNKGEEKKAPVVGDSFMFSFYSVRDAMDCCKVFAGAGPVDSSFYYLHEDDTYFLIVRRTKETPAGFEKCVLSANEFGELVTSEEKFISFVTEHGMCVAEEYAIETFLNVIPDLKIPGPRGKKKNAQAASVRKRRAAAVRDRKPSDPDGTAWEV